MRGSRCGLYQNNAGKICSLLLLLMAPSCSLFRPAPSLLLLLPAPCSLLLPASAPCSLLLPSTGKKEILLWEDHAVAYIKNNAGKIHIRELALTTAGGGLYERMAANYWPDRVACDTPIGWDQSRFKSLCSTERNTDTWNVTDAIGVSHANGSGQSLAAMLS